MELSAWTLAVRDAALGVVGRVLTRLPDVLGAAILLLVGWLLARLSRAVVRRLLGRGLDRLRGWPFFRGEDRFGLRRSLPELAAALVFWAVVVVFAVAAVDTLGLSGVGDLLATLARYLPQVLAGVFIVFAGAAVAGLIHDAVSNAATAARVPYAAALARSAHASVLVLAVVMGADQAGIDSTFLMIALPVVLAAILGGAALAFGLGSRTAVSNIIAAYHMLQLYDVGQRVRIAGFEGRILSVTPTSVVLDTEAGHVAVPAKLFSEQISVLLAEAER
jgi:small-conductance mechanosensitive channel